MFSETQFGCNVWLCIVDNHDIISLKLYDIGVDRQVLHLLCDNVVIITLYIYYYYYNCFMTLCPGLSG